VSERFERLEETLQIAHQMWDGNEMPFDGKHHQLARPLNSPRPVQKPHPPILIGGSGERKTLRLVAQYGDGCNLFARLGDDELKRKLDILRDHCQSIGRPYEEIEKTTLNSFQLTRDGRNGSMSPDAAIEHLASLAAMGIDQAIFSMPNVYDLEPFDLLATEIIPVVEKIQVAGR
jgi:alkanesulfonate monooxygenase SsuD/methylene tetrahydromethanopterin reductase-like flavin-dependent oxidoreductase (luciferase family)